MADYAKLIDAETWAFIERTNSWYPPETAEFSIERQRAIYDAMCREFFAGYPQGVTAVDKPVSIAEADVPARHYALAGSEPSALILYFHGGGFVVGGLESHDDVCAEICQRTGNPVVSVDYRLAPEHLHPASYEDCLAAFHWAAANFTLPILLCGDSAGANLAAAVSHAVRRHPRAPIGQVLIYAGLGGDMDKGSYVTHAEAPMLTLRDISFYKHTRTGGVDAGRDPTLAPLHDTDFSGLPRTVAIAAQCDPLCDDGAEYCARIRAAGGEAHAFTEPGLVHGYLRARHSVTRARDSFTRIVESLKALKGPEVPWPFDW